MTVTILSLLAAVAVPSLQSMLRSGRLRTASRTLVGDLTRARGMVVSGRQNFPGWANTERTQQAGIRFVSSTRYVVFADRDTDANGTATEHIVTTRTLSDPVRTVGTPPEVRFRRNGTLVGAASGVEVGLQDPEAGTTKTVRVAFGGKADIVR